MTQDVKHFPSLSTAKKSSNVLLDPDTDSGSSITPIEDMGDIDRLREQVRVAQNSIKFLQREHAIMLKGLHEETERLNELCRDLQFKCEAGGCVLPDSEFFKCSTVCLEQKVNHLMRDNCELKRKLSESHQAIDILDQKEKLALWQHHQEMEQRDNAILRLEKELEAKCDIIAQLTPSQGSRRKKGNFWRRFSFAPSSDAHPSPSSSNFHHPPMPRVEHLSREDLPSEMQNSFESQYQSYSSYSSLSDKSVSDDEGFGQCGETSTRVKLPPISKDHLPLLSRTRHLVRHQLRIDSLAKRMTSDTLAIDQMQPPEVSVKRLNKA